MSERGRPKERVVADVGESTGYQAAKEKCWRMAALASGGVPCFAILEAHPDAASAVYK